MTEYTELTHNIYSSFLTIPLYPISITNDALYLEFLYIILNKTQYKRKYVPVIDKFLKDKLNGHNIIMFMWEYNQYGPAYIMKRHRISEDIVEQFGKFSYLF